MEVKSHSYRRLDRSVISSVAIYLATALLTVAIAAWLLQLWRADWSVPMPTLNRFGGDYLFYDMMVKNAVERGLHNTNPLLGAPNQAELYDFPLPYPVHFFFLRAAYIFSRNFAVALNLYFMLSFPLCATLALLVFRHFKISYLSAIPGSVLFAFLPYHFIRGEDQITLSAYYLVPLTFLICLWLCTGKPLFWFEHEADDGNRHWITTKGAVGLASCVLLASDNPYHAFFSAFFLAIAGLAGRFRYGHGRATGASAILLVVLSSTFGLNITPSLIYIMRHGRNYEVTMRTPEQAESYGMKIAQLILPVTGHRVKSLAAIKKQYNQQAPLVNGNDTASLGLIGTIGFLALILRLILGNPANWTHPLFDPLSILNISGVLLATIGGFSSLFSFFVSSTIRNYNRLSVFIAFLALFAVVLLLERIRQIFAARIGAVPARNGLFALLIVSLLFLGIFDQTTPTFIPKYAELKAEYKSDADFVSHIESSLRQNAMVFQLPYVPFPEPSSDYPFDYDHLRGYLHSSTLRWSYGAMKGREGDEWERKVAAMPVNEMAENLAFAGFGGIYVDRFGYSDHAAQLESELAQKLGSKAIVSPNQRLSFFPLSQLIATLREQYTSQEWETKEDAALHPVLADWRLGFYPLESSPGQNWRWCCYFSRGELFIFNLSGSPKKTEFEMDVSTHSPDPSHLRISGPSFSKDFTVNAESRLISFGETVLPGRHIIRFVSDAKAGQIPGDKRALVFRVSNFHVTIISDETSSRPNSRGPSP